ncbi:MAG TPA: TetR/AcrR family transcriptional regulator, partial [Myxococcota bacterium]
MPARRPPSTKRKPAASKQHARPAKPRDPHRRERILVVAKKHFTAFGFKRTSVDAIAREAHCAKGALYLEFPDKRALLHELVMRVYETVSVRYEAEVLQLPSPLDRVVAALGFSFREWAADPFYQKLVEDQSELRALATPDVVGAVKTQLALMNQWLAEAKRLGELRDDVDVDAIPFVLTVLKYA